MKRLVEAFAIGLSAGIVFMCIAAKYHMEMNKEFRAEVAQDVLNNKDDYMIEIKHNIVVDTIQVQTETRLQKYYVVTPKK